MFSSATTTLLPPPSPSDQPSARSPFVVRVDSTSFRVEFFPLVCETPRLRACVCMCVYVHAYETRFRAKGGWFLLDNVYGAKGAPLLARIITWPAS